MNDKEREGVLAIVTAALFIGFILGYFSKLISG
jgi:hypothetical protein